MKFEAIYTRKKSNNCCCRFIHRTGKIFYFQELLFAGLIYVGFWMDAIHLGRNSLFIFLHYIIFIFFSGWTKKQKIFSSIFCEDWKFCCIVSKLLKISPLEWVLKKQNWRWGKKRTWDDACAIFSLRNNSERWINFQLGFIRFCVSVNFYHKLVIFWRSLDKLNLNIIKSRNWIFLKSLEADDLSKCVKFPPSSFTHALK